MTEWAFPVRQSRTWHECWHGAWNKAGVCYGNTQDKKKREEGKDRETNAAQHFKEQILPLHDGIFCGNVRNGGGTGCKPSACTVFQLIPDCMDHHYRNDYDSHGARQCVGRQTGG